MFVWNVIKYGIHNMKKEDIKVNTSITKQPNDNNSTANRCQDSKSFKKVHWLHTISDCKPSRVLTSKTDKTNKNKTITCN